MNLIKAPHILTRKQAIMVVAIPQQIQLMVAQGYPPSWELFSRSTGWQETIENLGLTKADQDEYRDMWEEAIDALAKKGAN